MTKRIDLHGKFENESILIIDSAIWGLEEGQYDSLELITGNGQVLKNLAIDMARNKGFNYKFGLNNPGLVIIFD